MTWEKKYCFLFVRCKSGFQSPYEDVDGCGWERSAFPVSVKPQQQHQMIMSGWYEKILLSPDEDKTRKRNITEQLNWADYVYRWQTWVTPCMRRTSEHLNHPSSSRCLLSWEGDHGAMAGAPHGLTSNLVKKNAGKNCWLHIYVANKDVRQLQCLKVEVQT